MEKWRLEDELEMATDITQAADPERDARAWALRAQGGLTFEEIAQVLARADGAAGRGVTKARAWQIVREEFRRRAAEAGSPEEIERLFRAARSRSLEPALREALERFNGEGGNGGEGEVSN